MKDLSKAVEDGLKLVYETKYLDSIEIEDLENLTVEEFIDEEYEESDEYNEGEESSLYVGTNGGYYYTNMNEFLELAEKAEDLEELDHLYKDLKENK